MSDDLRRAYLLGDSRSLHGNLPGTELESPIVESTTIHAFAAMPRPFENRNDHWQGGPASGRTYTTARPTKPDGTLNLQEKTWNGAT